jgi:DNA polymerase-3 subunit beta
MVLNSIHLKANAVTKSLTIEATDLDSYISCDCDCDVTEDIDVCINGKSFLDVLRGLSDTVQLSCVDSVLHISSGGFTADIAGTPTYDWPECPKLDNQKQLNISVNSLKTLINKTSYAASLDTTRAQLCGINFVALGEQIKAVATDGHVLAEYKGSLSSTVSEKTSFIINVGKLLLLLKAVEGSDEVVVSVSDKNVLFDNGKAVVVLKTIDGTYPDYERVIPKNHDRTACIDREDVIKAIKRVGVVSNAKTRLVKLSFTGNMLTLTTRNLDIGASANDTITCEFSGDDLVMGFNSALLVETLNNIQEHSVTMLLNGPIGACVVNSECGDGRFLIMPLRILEEI